VAGLDRAHTASNGPRGDRELAEFFRKAQSDSRKVAELGKQMLRSRLTG
jgi:hypothetical protein